MNKLEQAARHYMSVFGQALEAHGIPFSKDQLNADAALREALRPEVAPDGRVARTVFTLDDMTKSFEEGRKNGRTEALAEQALQKLSDFHQSIEQKPVAWIEVERGIPMFARFADKYKPTGDGFIPLYTHHVRTKDLTDDELEAVINAEDGKHIMRDATELELARAVIAADREKNK